MGALQQSGITVEPASSLRIGALHLRVHHGSRGLPPVLPDREEISEAIDNVLREMLDPSDPSYWVVRRLHVPFRAEANHGVGDLTEGFARALRVAVYRILCGETVDGVRRYDSRAHWLADCLWAQACATASAQWQFGRYRDHDPLPPADAVRLTLSQESETGLAALAILSEQQRLRPFCDRLGDTAARAILRLLLVAKSSSGRHHDERMQQLLAEERNAAPQRRYIPLLVAIARFKHNHPDRPLPGLNTVMQWADLDYSSIPHSVNENVFAPTSQPQPEKRLHKVDDSRTALAANNKAVTVAGSTKDTSRPGSEVLETGFAGVFVLWRSVIEMSLLSLLPEGEEGGPARLALAAALTGPNHQAAWEDPALHWLCDYHPRDEHQAPPPPPDLSTRFINHFAEWRSPQPIAPALTGIGRVHLLQDQSSEDWLALGDRRHCLAAARALNQKPGQLASSARDPAIDLHWFGVAHRRARRGWALLARAAYGDFARRLNGLQGSSAAWLWDKLLAGWGVLEPGSPSVITLPRVQLDLVLRMVGLDGTIIETPAGPVRLRLPGLE